METDTKSEVLITEFILNKCPDKLKVMPESFRDTSQSVCNGATVPSLKRS
jgi:hypothetical protein